MTGDLTTRLADITAGALTEWCGHFMGEESIRHTARHVAEVLVSSMGWQREERWVPVTEYGSRWTPREKREADGLAAVFGGDGGITHTECVSRWVSAWERSGG